MTPQENKQRVRNEALNKIIKLFHPKTQHSYTYYDGEGSTLEQMAFDIKHILKEMNKELDTLKTKPHDKTKLTILKTN